MRKMGIWGALAVMALVILMSVAVGNVTDIVPGTVERVDTLEANAPLEREDDPSPVVRDGAEVHEWRQIGEGDGNSTELPSLAAIVIIVFSRL